MQWPLILQIFCWIRHHIILRKGFNVAKCQMQFTLEQGEVHNFIVNSIIIQLVFTSINSLKNPLQLIEFISCKITPYYCWYGAWLNFFCMIYCIFPTLLSSTNLFCVVSDVYVILGYMCLVLVYTGRSNVFICL